MPLHQLPEQLADEFKVGGDRALTGDRRPNVAKLGSDFRVGLEPRPLGHELGK